MRHARRAAGRAQGHYHYIRLQPLLPTVAASVTCGCRCATPVELLAVDKAMFLLLTKEQGSTLTRRMHERFERRQVRLRVGVRVRVRASSAAR